MGCSASASDDWWVVWDDVGKRRGQASVPGSEIEMAEKDKRRVDILEFFRLVGEDFMRQVAAERTKQCQKARRKRRR